MAHYPDYHEREDMKSECYKACLATDDPSAQARFIVNGLIEAHYWRAREALENLPKPKIHLKKIIGKKYYPGCVLEFDDYATHWLWANGDRQNPEAIKKIEEIYHYKAKQNKYLTKGYSQYFIRDGEYFGRED